MLSAPLPVDDVVHAAADNDLVLRGVEGRVVMFIIMVSAFMIAFITFIVAILVMFAFVIVILMLVFAGTEGEDLRDAGAGLVGSGEQDVVAIRTFCAA